MRYELYIDVYFLINFGMDLALLTLLGETLKQAAPWRRKTAGAALGALAACLAAVWDPAGWKTGEAIAAGGARTAFWKMGLALYTGLEILVPACVMVRTAFRPGSLRGFLKAVLTLFFLSVCACGLLEALYRLAGAGLAGGKAEAALPFLIRAFLAAGAFFLLRFFRLCAAETRRETGNLYRVILRLGKTTVEATALYDTGNRLREPGQGQPVHIVTEKLWRRLMQGGGGEAAGRIRRIPFRTVANPLGFMDAARLDALRIRREHAPDLVLPAPWIGRAPFSVSREGSYEMLLHEESFYHSSGQKGGGITDGDQGIDTEPFSL